MIVMDVKLDNLLCFNDFHMNFSYPKKIVDSYIEREYLSERPNFRYRKVNILMGSNATGKTSLGKMLMNIFNFIDKKNPEHVTDAIADKKRDAFFSMDFVLPEIGDNILYRIETKISVPTKETYNSEDINVCVKKESIKQHDNYEKCAERLETKKHAMSENYVTELEKIDGLSWFFIFPADKPINKRYKIDAEDRYFKILEVILKLLDPAIIKVEKIDSVENSYVIKMRDKEIIVQDGKMARDKEELLSTGTKAGIEVSNMIASIDMNNHAYYYCDEKFSYVSSDIEKALLALMISKLSKDRQLFFTTHNMDILDMPLPKHSFNFLKKRVQDGIQYITIENAGDYLKKNTDSVKNAVINDLFSSSASLEILDEIEDM